jgi:pentatricopeptide repeat protein
MIVYRMHGTGGNGGRFGTRFPALSHAGSWDKAKQAYEQMMGKAFKKSHREAWLEKEKFRLDSVRTVYLLLKLSWESIWTPLPETTDTSGLLSWRARLCLTTAAHAAAASSRSAKLSVARDAIFL